VVAQVKVVSNIDRLASQLERKLGPKMAQATMRAGEVVAGQIRREISAWTSNTSTKKSGALARSFQTKLVKTEGGNVEVGVYSSLPYARIHERGGVIRPKNGKFLTIPISPQAQRTTARRFPEPLFYLHRPPAHPVLAEQLGGDRVQAHYILRTSVRIAAKGYLTKAADKSLPVAQEIVRRALQETFTEAA
jgi:hypothetical protein